MTRRPHTIQMTIGFGSILGLLWTLALLPGLARGANCSGIGTGRVPLSELGSASYLGFEGGLYPGGSNVPPPDHFSQGLTRAVSLEPLAADGTPDADGRVVLLSIGMSNTTQEFCSPGTLEPCSAHSFMGQAAAHPDVEHETLVIANGAIGSQPAENWASPSAPTYDFVRDLVLTPKGLTEAQVRVIWLKQAQPALLPTLPEPTADAILLGVNLAHIARAIAVRYPNAELVFLSSRIYAGYADSPLNPEPYAYETGFAVKWLIQAQIGQMAGAGIDPIVGDLDYLTGTAPWLAWGPYLWADGLTPRADSLTWECQDFEASDGTHPAILGQQKVGALLLNFMLTSPFTTPWFLADSAPPAVPALSGVAIKVLALWLIAAASTAPTVGRILRCRSRSTE